MSSISTVFIIQISIYSYILITIILSTSYDGCKFNITDSNNITSEYDLSSFYFAEGYHEVDDSEDREYEYKFNICGQISPKIFTNNKTIPSYCIGDDKGPCLSFDDTNGTVSCSNRYPTSYTTVASAVQIDATSTNPTCHWLGMELDEKIYGKTNPNYDISLLNPDNSGAGTTNQSRSIQQHTSTLYTNCIHFI